MNWYTKKIAELLKISLDDARRIQHKMYCSGFDFSEATDDQLISTAQYIRKDILEQMLNEFEI